VLNANGLKDNKKFDITQQKSLNKIITDWFVIKFFRMIKPIMPEEHLTPTADSG
jgi:hypothetical protein